MLQSTDLCIPIADSFMPEIPEQLKWYTPLNLGVGTGLSNWKISVDEMTSYIEIKRTPLVRLSIVLSALLFGAILSGMLFALYIDDDFIEEGKPFLFYAMILVPPLFVAVFVALDILCSLADSRHWNGPLRFRYNFQNGELFFSRENVIYRAGDYEKLILGCVRGADMEGYAKNFGGMWSLEWNVKSLNRRRLRQQTQIFMLVFDNNGEWQRHNLADDDWVTWWGKESGSRQFIRIANLLERHLLFERFVKDYSLDECYEQQRQ